MVWSRLSFVATTDLSIGLSPVGPFCPHVWPVGYTEMQQSKKVGRSGSYVSERHFSAPCDQSLAQKDTQRVRVVRDSGPGFLSGQATVEFSPFATTKATGFGIGLSSSRTIIEAHGGQ